MNPIKSILEWLEKREYDKVAQARGFKDWKDYMNHRYPSLQENNEENKEMEK